MALNKAVDSKTFRTMKQKRDDQISHLLFADDILIFGRADMKSLKTLEDIMVRFASLAGLSMITDKTKLYAGIIINELMAWCQHWNIGFGMLPAKYLGLPLL